MLQNNDDLVEEFPNEYDNDLAELEDSRMEYDDETGDDGGEAPTNDEMSNELSELQALGGGGMNDESAAEKDYVEASKHDMRRTKQVNADMADKLQKQEEEHKDPNYKKRNSRVDMRHR